LEEIAAHPGVSKDTVHRWIRRRGMPAHKVGRLWKFRVSQVQAGEIDAIVAELERGQDNA